MRFDVTVPTPGSPTQHRGITPDQVAELVDHAATHGLHLRIRPHQPQSESHGAHGLHPGGGSDRGAGE
ncbi:hypothetical protein [Streptacidiphilus rugosus]|uniref:hypothetical protein n=1 Tax=Streptacidiphilus rugosus TaxID=405783 RepID=UPI00056C34B6|nr:hypothetical protein [Streptacidiphilus rugosus]